MASIDKLRCKFYSDFKDFTIWCICNKPSLLNNFYNPFITRKEWELVSDKFDINTLIPFESRVLVRDNDYDEWKSSFWGHLRQKANIKYDTIRGTYRQCIPYEGNEHLLGTVNDCDEFYKTR